MKILSDIKYNVERIFLLKMGKLFIYKMKRTGKEDYRFAGEKTPAKAAFSLILRNTNKGEN